MTASVALLTDFGTSDSYVGTMKAVISAAVPSVSFIDVTHEIPPQDIRRGAFHLLTSYAFHAPGTIFLCVVDPGVGSSRKILYAEAGKRRFLGPDNGLLSWVLEKEAPDLLVDASNPGFLPGPVSETFHGRDIMAPIVGKLLSGFSPSELGPRLMDFVRLPFPMVNKIGSRWTGEVLAVDRFGNLVTNFSNKEVARAAGPAKLWFDLDGFKETVRGLHKTYADVEPGRVLAVPGSSGFIEISVRDGNASQRTGLREGGRITLHMRT